MQPRTASCGPDYSAVRGRMDHLLLLEFCPLRILEVHDDVSGCRWSYSFLRRRVGENTFSSPHRRNPDFDLTCGV